MRILFVINTMGMGGAERAMLALMHALPADAQIDLLSLVNRGELFKDVPARVRILNKAPDSGPLLGARGRRALASACARALLYRFGFLREGKRLIQTWLEQKKAGRVMPDKLMWRLIARAAPEVREEYDLAVAYLEGGATYYVADRVRAKRKAAFVHIDYTRAGYSPRMDADAYDKMDRIYAVSNTTKEKFAAARPAQKDKLFVFPNIIDVSRIQALANAGPGFEDNFQGTRLLTIGRLHPQKGYDIAIPAFRALLDAGYRARWYVLGEGPERAKLERQIASEHLEDDFLLLGAKGNPYPYLKQADIYVHATRFEGKSIAIEEAQVLSKPIIATDCVGNREQIASGVDGLLIPLKAEALTEALKDAIDEPERMRAYARACALKETGTQADADAFYAYAMGGDAHA